MVATPAGGLRILVGGVQATGCLLATSSAWRPHGPELVASLGVGRRIRSFCETGEGYSDLFRQVRCRTIGAPVQIPATAMPQVLVQKVRVGCRQLANRNSDRRPEISPILRRIVRQNASTRSVLCAGLGRGYREAMAGSTHLCCLAGLGIDKDGAWKLAAAQPRSSPASPK